MTKRSDVRIAWISKGKCNTFFDISRFGARSAAAELAGDANGSLTVELLEPDDCSTEPDTASAGEVSAECTLAAPQMAILQDAIDREFEVIAISVTNPICIGPLLDGAVHSGIKVITFDSDAPESQRDTYYGMDNEASGRLAVRTIAALLEERGEVAIQTSMTEDADGNFLLSTSDSYVGRMKGITEELANYPDINLVATVPCIGGDVSDPSCATELESVLEAHANLAGFILSRGKVLREIDIASAAPTLAARVQAGTLHSVAFDAPDDALTNIEAGFADAVIGQKQFGWGYDVVKLAYDMVVDGFEPPPFYDSGWYVVCPNNVEQYRAMWAENDFRNQLDACQYVTE